MTDNRDIDSICRLYEIPNTLDVDIAITLCRIDSQCNNNTLPQPLWVQQDRDDIHRHLMSIMTNVKCVVSRLSHEDFDLLDKKLDRLNNVFQYI